LDENSGPSPDINFNRLVSQKYQFPLSMGRLGALKELQQPLSVTAEDIMKDLLKFVSVFPLNVIPHMNE
jgi:hypothetical protein